MPSSHVTGRAGGDVPAAFENAPGDVRIEHAGTAWRRRDPRTARTELAADRRTARTRWPGRIRQDAFRPCLPMTIASACQSQAASMSRRTGSPSSTIQSGPGPASRGPAGPGSGDLGPDEMGPSARGVTTQPEDASGI